MLYFRIVPDIHQLHGIREYPQLPRNLSFLSGQLIQAPLTRPLTFTVSHPAGERPGHYLGAEVPVVSKAFADALQESGVDNIQLFPAALKQPKTGELHEDYFAINFIGLVDALDPSSSSGDVIMPGGPDVVPPLMDFTKLVFSHARTNDLLAFRLVQDPTDPFLRDRVLDHLRARRPASGWGLTTYQVPVRD